MFRGTPGFRGDHFRVPRSLSNFFKIFKKITKKCLTKDYKWGKHALSIEKNVCILNNNVYVICTQLYSHLESVHGEIKEKNLEFFIRKRDELLKSINCMVQTTKTVNEKATEAFKR